MGGEDPPVRSLVVWCPGWPLVAAGIPADQPAVVVRANRVIAVSAPARREGIEVGQRRREAQSRCPGVQVVDHDPAQDARRFEVVMRAIDAVTPRSQILRPGTCVFPVRSPSRYFGGDAELAARTAAVVDDAAGVGTAAPGRTARVGIADGIFAAGQAARRARPGRPVIVAPGETPAFLAPLPVEVLPHSDLVDILQRLGLTSLGDLAALDRGDVSGRFGAAGIEAHRLACGLDRRPPDTRVPPPDLVVSRVLDPPALQIDQVAFVARAAADEFHQRLADLGLACVQIVVEAETEHAERHSRTWRHEGTLTAGAVAERVRWQLDGWLAASADTPTAGIEFLRLVPGEVVPARGRQLGFWGAAAVDAGDAVRVLARVQRMLGPGSVTVTELRGGRGPGDQVERLPVDAVDLAGRSTVETPDRAAPWPGRIPPPAPAVVWPQPVPAEVVGAGGEPVQITGRGLVTVDPTRISVAGQEWAEVVAWAGPWPYEERWWDHQRARRRARMQVVVDGGPAYLLVLEGGRWGAEALYD